MEIHDLISRFSDTKEKQEKAIFSTLFIAGNRLQTIFDNDIPDITLKQFMLLTMVKQSEKELTFTQLGKLLGCSRQNIKKLAEVLAKKGYVSIQQNSSDIRAACIAPTDKMNYFFKDIFIAYEKKLSNLFEGYNEQEIEQFFHLMMKLYTGIETFEKGLNHETK